MSYLFCPRRSLEKKQNKGAVPLTQRELEEIDKLKDIVADKPSQNLRWRVTIAAERGEATPCLARPERGPLLATSMYLRLSEMSLTVRLFFKLQMWPYPNFRSERTWSGTP